MSENTRWYLDSDVKRKLSGATSIDITSRTFSEDISLTTSPLSLGTGKIFLYVKNSKTQSEGNVEISFNGTDYPILLAPGEVFASKIATDSDLYIKSASSSLVDYVIGT